MADALTAERPAGCDPVMTVQALGCQVETTMRCTDPAGPAWRSEGYDLGGLFYVSTFTPDFVQIDVLFPQDGIRYAYDQTQSSSTSPADSARIGHGVERLHGLIQAGDQQIATFSYHDIARVEPPLVVDGTSLVALRVNGTKTLSPPLRAFQVDFMNYFEPKTGALVGGESLTPDADGKTSLNGRPAALFFPGEPGFDVNIPTYDCPNISFNVTDEKADQS